MFFFYSTLLLNYLTFVYCVELSDPSTRNIKEFIINENTCSDGKIFCNTLSENDELSVLECMLSNPSRLIGLPENCQHTIWDHIRRLLKDDKVYSILLPLCQTDLNTLDCKIRNNGNYLKCILNNMDNIQNTNCRQLIIRLENIAFTDYLWISSFLQHCTDDINKLKCGRLDSQTFTQIKTVTCLQDNILILQDKCKKEIFHLSELQSDNIKLDAQLYLDCANDRIRYCAKFSTGSGRVFPCLILEMHKDHTKLETKCHQHLLRRLKLVAQDYLISKGLLKACREDIKKAHCRKLVSDDKQVRLAQILLCLENAMKNGTKIDLTCKDEMNNHRRMLMEDYRLSPEIVNNCANEVAVYCNGFKGDGTTIHCLMEHALRKSKNDLNARIQDKCMRALEDLVRETDAGENWSVDPILYQACNPVVQIACRGIPGGDAKIMSCLLDKLETEYMNEDCENALIQLQYFVARDFRLDPQLYRECKEDAIKFCHIREDDALEGPSYSHEVLPCLYRHAYLQQVDMKLQKPCLQQIRRVMRQRAVSVDLQPEIEEACLNDLGALCNDKFKKGEEMQCLQDNLEELEDECHNVVEYFTEIEAQHVDLNPYINKYCKRTIINVCKMQINDDEGSVMDCLIQNKNNPLVKSNQACFASIEHFQIISLKDYRFSYKFKVACKTHAIRLCSHARSKTEVIACLSEHLLNATVHGVKSSIPKGCKQQLRAQIFQQRESINLNPTLKLVCSAEIKKFCNNIQTGNSQVVECLQTLDPEKLSKKCEKQLFKVKQLGIYDNSVDYALQTMCGEAINLFCPHHNKETILDCLKENKNEKGFSKMCRSIVNHRLVEQNTNYLLNPSLQQNCNLDILKFCSNEPNENFVIKCLKNQFKLSKLSNKCEKGVAQILREQALSVDLNPLIKVICKNELETICKLKEEDSGKVEECLKTALIKKNIHTPECRYEVANMIEESQVDIEADPVLQSACALDLLTFCNNVTQGNGRHIQCLRNKMEQLSLTPNCKNKLRERFQMYKNAIEVLPLSDLSDLYQQVVSSPSKSYLFIFLLMIASGIFITGVLCGKLSRNRYKLLKNK